MAGFHLLNVDEATHDADAGANSAQRSGTAIGFRQSVAFASFASAIALAATPEVGAPNSVATMFGRAFA